MDRRALKVRVTDGDALGEDALREAWELRGEMVKLHKSPEDDWAQFRELLCGPDKCLFGFHDPEGRLQGFFTIAFVPLDEGGRRALLMYSKFFYFRPAYRGHYKTILTPWLLVPRALRRYGVRSLHFVTTAFPQSYTSLSRTSGRVFSLRDPDIPDWERAALTAFASLHCAPGFDVSTGLVGGSNVTDSPALPRSAEAKRLHATYETLNPDWREGYSLPILFNVDRRLVQHNVKRIGRRVLRR